MPEIGQMLLQAIVSSFFSGVLVSLILGYFITKRDEKIRNSIQEEFKKRDAFFNAQIDYKRRALEELLGPVMIQLKRSAITLDAYDSNNSFREAILKECNEKVRDLLLIKSFLIPTDLLPHAAELIKHYDEWLQHYNKIRVTQAKSETPFVFTYNFPTESEEKFLEAYDTFRKELRIEQKLD